MGVFSVLTTPRSKVYAGKLADLMVFGTPLGVQDLAIATDQPGLMFRGDGIHPISGLTPVGTTQRSVATALNTTAAATAAAVLAAIRGGLITSTSAAAVTITLPTAAQLAASFNGVKGVSVEFIVDNAAGANTVTVATATGVTVATAVITGSDTLTVAAGKVGIFRLYFVSSTAVLLSRVQ